MTDFWLGVLVASTTALALVVLTVLVFVTKFFRFRDLRLTRDDAGEVMVTALLRSPEKQS